VEDGMALRERLPRAAVAVAAVAVVGGLVGAGIVRASPDHPSHAAAATSSSPAVTSADPTPTSATPAVTAARSKSEPTPGPTHRTAATPRPSKRTATAASVGTPTPRPTGTRPFRFPVPVTVGNATQVITVQSRGSYATVLAWQHRSDGWHQVLATTAARVGPNGVVPGAARRQGSGTTPGGTYTLTQAFGIRPNPGARLPYHQVTNDDWWVEDNLSAYYNQMRGASQGGFRTNLPSSDINSSEHLVDYAVPYQYAVVIDFNRWPAVRYRGAGIFLHVNGTGATAGCVSVPLTTMVSILRWLDPAQHPRIAIA
jgi:L,D-peptidoglycan transpeptidase YkuD (ErfK/YbiS/YcfS/YnhG family)